MKFGRKIKYLIIYLSLILFCSIGCKKSGPVEPPDPPQPLPDDLALFASIDGNWTGIWVFDTDSLKLIDSLQTISFTSSIEFSPNYSIWYTIVRDHSDNAILIAIDARTKNILQQAITRNPFLISALQGRLLVGYYVKVTEIFDPETFLLIRADSLGWVDKAIACPKSPKLYLLSQSYNLNDPGPRVVIYDLRDFKIDRTIELTDITYRRNRMQSSALAISPDGKYLFVTVFNWVGGGGYGTFHAIDLTNNQVVAEYLCGKFSQMGVSPDGRYVYISDPAGYKYMMVPTDHVLRYNIHSLSMEVFINGLRDIGLAGKMLMITDQVVIAPDNRTMFLTFMGDAHTTDGKQVHMIKLDILTKKVLGIYSIPPDYRGYITQIIVKLKLGKYPQ